jgi:hypothetical protein
MKEEDGADGKRRGREEDGGGKMKEEGRERRGDEVEMETNCGKRRGRAAKFPKRKAWITTKSRNWEGGAARVRLCNLVSMVVGIHFNVNTTLQPTPF